MKFTAAIAMLAAMLLGSAASAQEAAQKPIAYATLKKDLIAKGWSLETGDVEDRKTIHVDLPNIKVKVKAMSSWVVLPSFPPVEVKVGETKRVCFDAWYVANDNVQGSGMLMPKAAFKNITGDLIGMYQAQTFGSEKAAKMVVFLQERVEVVGGMDIWYEAHTTSVVFTKSDKAEVKLLVNSPDEPIAKTMSLAKAAAFLDHQSKAWTAIKKCGTCHTNYPYLVARGQLGGDLAALKEVRGFFEQRIANWDSGKKGDAPARDTEVIATAATLALQDSLTTGKLHPLTRKALDRMWKLQQPNGAWDWLKCGWPPLEHDDYYGVVYVTLAVGQAPDKYAETEQAKKGLDGFRKFFKNNPPPSLHHKTMLLWAAQKVDGIMSDKLKQSTIQELRTAQKADGGWSLPSLGDWVGRDERPNDRSAPSDGYATGLVIYVLRQAGAPAKDPAIQRGLAWLKNNQRESGRWFTRSLNTDRYHFITHAGTAYAVLALKACE